MNDQAPASITLALVPVLAFCALLPPSAAAQDRLKLMPGYDNYVRVKQQVQAAWPGVVSGAVTLGAAGTSGALTWSADSKGFDYTWNSRRYHFDLATRKSTQLPTDASVAPRIPAPAAPPAPATSPCSGAPAEYGRSPNIVASPDGARHAIARERRVFIGDRQCGQLVPITTDGSDKSRVKYGTTPWVYGEELEQTTGMWWSKTGTKLAYYRFDESKVPDFYIARDQTKLHTTVAVEAFPKAGEPNPVPDLFVYDLATRQTTRLDVRDGNPFTNDVMGHYVYDVAWSPDGNELFVNRKNRRQNVTEFVACSPGTGHCRVIIREAWPSGWAAGSREMRWLSDSTRFIWSSRRNGYSNFYLYDLTGKLITSLTEHAYEVGPIVRVDEQTKTLWYRARDGDNTKKWQLHRVGLDGKNDRRLTDPAFAHHVDVSPDGRYFVDVAQTYDQPPFSQVVDVATGRAVAQLARSDFSKLESIGFRKGEMFSFVAADGKTRLLGSLTFPPTCDPAKKYPVLMYVYGGPNSADGTTGEMFPTSSGLYTESLANYGFILLSLDTRASQGLGKPALDALYLKLGQTEIDDLAAGVKSLWSRPWFDKDHVGICGTSYGGYSSLMAILRYPDVFAAVAMSPATDWRNYDTIYTERYMWLPDENKDGYDKGPALSYVNNLKGELLIYYATHDNNAHNIHSMQLISALQQAGKHFEVQVGPDRGHGPLNPERVMEFLIQSLVIKPKYGLAY